MRVLVIFPGALGDLICLGPTIRAIARRHPHDSVDLMARAELARFAVGRMGIAHGYSIDRREVAALFRHDAEVEPTAIEFFGQFGRIYSWFASDDSDFSSNLKAVAGGKVSFHPFRPPGEGHISRLYLDSIGAHHEPLESRIELLQSDLNSAEHLLSEIGATARGFWLIFPGSGSSSKNWPSDRFVRLASETASFTKPAVVLGPAEAGIERDFQDHGIATLSDLPLETVAALARLSGGFVGNDSGVSHLSGASGGRGVVIFGPTDPDRWMPLGDVVAIRREPFEALEVSEVVNIVRSRLVS